MSSNVPTWIFITNVSLDALVILTVPVYLIFMKHLIQCKKENIYSSAFVLILFANGFWDMFSSIIYLLFNELPQQGIFVEFYTVNPLWKARTSKAVEFGVRFFQLMSVVIVAVNRFFAVKRPLTYSRVFSSRRTKYIYITLYICTFLYMAPILFVADATVYFDAGLIFYGFHDAPFVLVYGMTYFTMALITFLIWVVAYSQISLYITQQSNFRQNKSKKSVAKMAAASFFFTLGTIISFIISVSSDVAWRFFGIANLYPPATFFCLTRIGQEMANLSTPWVMLLLSPEIRKGMLIAMGIKSESTMESRVFLIRELKSQNHTNTSQNTVSAIHT